jgi:hypothetical protein
MFFDTADVADLESSGQFSEVILHEMAHVLGFGSLWPSFALNLLAGPAALGGTDPHFIGLGAIEAFNNGGGAGYAGGAKVPVENCIGFPPDVCGDGSRDSHWRESVFASELMTGFISPGSNPLSVITTASMGDEGYQVNYAASDPYTVTNAISVRARGAAGIKLEDDILRLPIFMVDARGRVTGVVHPR